MSYQRHFRQRKPRNRHNNNDDSDPSSYKPTIVSDTLTANNDIPMSSTTKKKHFSSAAFRGLGCTASPQVSVPSLIRASATWEPSKNSRAKTKRLEAKKTHRTISNGDSNSKNGSLPANNAAGTSQSTSLSLALADASSMGCVVSAPRLGRPKVDGVLCQGERCHPSRRIFTHEDAAHFLESEAGLAMMPRIVSGSRRHRHLRNNYCQGGLAEILMIQRNIQRGLRSNWVDVYKDMRLDIDNMSYEELLELGDRIGYVSTGLGEEEISSCVRRTKLSNSKESSLRIASEAGSKCSICQVEYEAEDEMGRLRCGHCFHVGCIRHWLAQKNLCPICKREAVSPRLI